MLSLVNYGASDSEDNISDEDEAVVSIKSNTNGVQFEEKDDQDLFSSLSLSNQIKLPQPRSKVQDLVEEDDEFLHKKETPINEPPPATVPKIKQKVKIMIPKLSDFNEEEDDDDKIIVGPKFSKANRKPGLLGMLPKPGHSKGINLPMKVQPSVESKTPAKSEIPSASTSSSSLAQPPPPQVQESKKIGLIPYALMDHKKTVESAKKLGKKKTKDSDDESDDDISGTFFSFNSKDDDLPQVNEEEIKAMIAKETDRLEQKKRRTEEIFEQNAQYEQIQSDYYEEQKTRTEFEEQAMKALLGGTKAKRSKIDNIQIVDICDEDVLPDKEEWHRKNLAGETSYIPTGNIDEKGPSALAKRKHQISYLSLRAEKNVAELEAMWAANRQSNREGRSKYGF